MASNSFGTLFRITTWGESHGKAIGVVIDGCPAGLPLEEQDILPDLMKRRPGYLPHTSPRKETDDLEILSGVFEGQTTGAPISLLIRNQDAHSASYELTKDLLRPGHANFTYLQKYGLFDYRGGGRASARETACRVAAGAIAKKILRTQGIDLLSYLKELGGISSLSPLGNSATVLREQRDKSSLFCLDPEAEQKMLIKLQTIEKDSLGGIIECTVFAMPQGLGDPVYEKLESNLAKAMLSIPASKGVEFGEGFEAARMYGSTHNDLFHLENGRIQTKTNHAGGTLGGISTGMPLIFRVAFKPTSSISTPQSTVDLQGTTQTFTLPTGSRHDPCLAIRAVPVVEAMTALVLVDAYLLNKTIRL